MSQPLVIASNRGPVSFSLDERGQLVPERGGGGLVTVLGPAVADAGDTWVAAAITPGDREAAGRGVIEAEGYRLRTLNIEPDRYRMFYDVIANGTLWFLHHRLWDLPRRPRLDAHWREAWEQFQTVNQTFARAVAEESPDGAIVLVQDYHLPLLGAELATKRPDLRVVHFSHTPFCTPDDLRILPDDAANALIEGLSGYRACGFHSRRWADAFEACCREVKGTAPPTFVSPAAPDADELARVAASDACRAELAAIEEQVGDRRLLVRVDRIELSKNILRGFHAFDELLRTRPEWRDRVVFGAFVYPSREEMAEYLGYRQEIESLVRHLNAKWATPSWTPILLHLSDNFPRAVAALTRYDALLVNPVRDGLNLVALEGPLVNQRDGVVLLSREAGIAEHIGEQTVLLNPFDVVDTAQAIDVALRMEADERSGQAAALRDAARSRTPSDWLADQVAAAG